LILFFNFNFNFNFTICNNFRWLIMSTQVFFCYNVFTKKPWLLIVNWHNILLYINKHCYVNLTSEHSYCNWF
jgi:hypothetical protein